MRPRARQVAAVVLAALFAASLLAELFAPASYDEQFRDAPNAAPSGRFLLGTDELGRDRLSRLLYGTRVSMLLAPAAALVAVLVAALVGSLAGYLGGWVERGILLGTDLFLSLPWLFLLLSVRALLPLNVSPLVSVMITFALLGLLGWAPAARVVHAGVRAIRASEFLLAAQACGCRRFRLLRKQVLPNLMPVLETQFWISIPEFIVAEANLGLLGLGVAEPLPSWGNLLRDLTNCPAVLAQPVRLAPLVLLVVILGCFQTIFTKEECSV